VSTLTIENRGRAKGAKFLDPSTRRESLIENAEGLARVNALAQGRFERWPQREVEGEER
jgi:hypothetical protein